MDSDLVAALRSRGVTVTTLNNWASLPMVGVFSTRSTSRTSIDFTPSISTREKNTPE
jgi:hypothetical protein